MLHLQRIVAVFAAPDIERVVAEGGLDDAIHTIQELCADQSLPVFFVLNRRRLGRVLQKNVRISVVAIVSYDGANELFAVSYSPPVPLVSGYP